MISRWTGEKQEYCSYSLSIDQVFMQKFNRLIAKLILVDKVLNVAIKHTDANNANYGVYSISLKKNKLTIFTWSHFDFVINKKGDDFPFYFHTPSFQGFRW